MIIRRAVTSRQDWLQWRREFLCASEVAAACGADDYMSPLALYAQKRGLISVADNSSMRRGRHFEVAAVSYIAEEYPEYFIDRPNRFIMDTESRLACTPDATLMPRDDLSQLINCQIKTISKPVFERWNGEPPPGYCLQVATENMLMDAASGKLAVLVVGNYDAELVMFDIPRHADAEDRIRQIAREFWENMESGLMPAADYRRDDEAIAAIFPNAEPGKTVDLSSDNRLAEILPKREELKELAKATAEEIKALDSEIRAKIGDAEIATLPGWRMSLKDTLRKSYTVKESRFRTLNVSSVGGDENESTTITAEPNAR